MKPIVSVIMPVYNTEKYLERAIRSVLDQSLEQWELILVDDGSTDKSADICDLYGKLDNRIRVIHQENGGLSEARNAGLKEAVGKYISFVDSDDWIKPDMLETLSGICKQNNAEVACCEFFITYEDGGIDDRTKEEKALEILNQKDAIHELLLDRKIQSFVCNKLFQREMFDGIEFPEGKHYEDIGTTYKVIMKANTIAVYNVSLYYYFQRQDSITHSLEQETAIIDHYDHMLFRIQMLNDISEKYPEYRDELCHISELAAIKLYNYSLVNKNADNQLRNQCIYESKRYLRQILKEIYNNPGINTRHKIRLRTLLHCPLIYRMMLKYTYKKRKNLS